MKGNSDLTVSIIVQARLGSSRLPGKVLKEVMNKPLLAYLIERLQEVKSSHNLIIATTTNPRDQPIIDFCAQQNILSFRGSEEDVLSRYYETVKKHPSDIVVRITSDCPLIDPEIIDDAIQYMIAHPEYDYISNSLQRTYPRGMDVEVFTAKCLGEAALEASHPYEREHVTPFIYQHHERYRLKNLPFNRNESGYRLTVDTIEDFELIKRILEEIYPKNPRFTLNDLLSLLQKHPDWKKINEHIKQKEGPTA